MLIVDVDGVLTDGSITLDSHGIESKTFNASDGSGFKFLQRAGLKCAIISGRKSEAVEHRATELGIYDVYQGAKNKIDAYNEILAKYDLKHEEICYVGDDLVDIPVMRKVGFPVAVANAAAEVKEIADYITNTPGGKGAAREVIEKIIKSQGKWDEIMVRYFKN